jgi:hypothetical protein
MEALNGCPVVMPNVGAGMEDPGDKGRQVGGTHYLKAIQPWDIIEAWDLDFWEGNALKYLLRYKDKGGLQDLEKLQHYLDKIRRNYTNES